MDFLRSLRDEIDSWCKGRSWLVRLPLLLWFSWMLVRLLGDPLYQPLFKSLNLGIHELGHYLFKPFGRFLEILGGSLTQCLAPALSMVMFFRQRDWFAIAVCFGWLSTNLFDVATYAGDARAMELPLIRPGGGHIIHDWHYLLAHTGWLMWDREIAGLLRCAGTASMGVCLGAGAWMLWRMFRNTAAVPGR